MFGRRVRPHIGAQLFASASALKDKFFHSFEASGVEGQAATGTVAPNYGLTPAPLRSGPFATDVSLPIM